MSQLQEAYYKWEDARRNSQILILLEQMLTSSNKPSE